MEHETSAIRRDGDDLILVLRVSPGSSRDEITREQDHLKVRLQAPAVDGKANKRLINLLGKAFGVPKSAVKLVRGDSARRKVVRIERPSLLPDFAR